MDEPTLNVAEEIQQEEAVQPQTDQESESNIPEGSSQEEKRATSKDENFIRLRETKEQLERENRELKQYYLKMQAKESPKEEDDFNVEDDDIVEGRIVRKLHNEIKELKKFRDSYNQEKQASIPDRLKSKFSDFEQVVTPENVEKLKQTEPELYASITAGGDLYNKGVSAYKTLRAIGIVKDDPYVSEKKQVQSNTEKPVSSQAIRGQGALSDANIFAQGLTPTLKKQLQKEMEEASKAR